MPSISEQLEYVNDKTQLKNGIEKLILDLYYEPILNSDNTKHYITYIKYESNIRDMLIRYLSKPNIILKFLTDSYVLIDNNIFIYINVDDYITELNNAQLYKQCNLTKDEINILRSKCILNFIKLNVNMDNALYLSEYIESYDLKYELDKLKILLNEQQNEIKQLKEKNKENEFEINYLKCPTFSKKITYDYNQIKKQNAKLNKEFLRIYKLIKKNIGYNLSD
jgi:hypothetical protein